MRVRCSGEWHTRRKVVKGNVILPHMQGVSREKDQRHQLLQQKSWWGFKHYLLTKQTTTPPTAHIHVYVSTHGETRVWRGASQDRALVCALVGGCQERLDLEFYVCPNRNSNVCGYVCPVYLFWQTLNLNWLSMPLFVVYVMTTTHCQTFLHWKMYCFVFW